MIGLDIKVKNAYNNYLYKMFKGIDLLNYEWEIITDDILYHENGDIRERLFDADIINGVEFVKCISRDSYYMIFADLKAYPLNNEHTEIKTLGDFVRSNCKMIFLCTDSTFIEFYCKERKILDKVYDNCKTSNYFEKIEYKSEVDVSGRVLIAW